MKIFIGADHRGFELKEKLKDFLRERGFSLDDSGAYSLDPADDYPKFAFAVGEKVAQAKEKCFGVVICGSGVGVAVAANKVVGVRAVLTDRVDVAELAREHDDVNVLCLGADIVSFAQACRIVEIFLNTEFDARPKRISRLEQIKSYEQTNNRS